MESEVHHTLLVNFNLTPCFQLFFSPLKRLVLTAAPAEQTLAVVVLA